MCTGSNNKAAGGRHADTAARHVLIHCHLFKNAGSTLDWSLRRSFGAGFVGSKDDHAMRQGPEALAAYVRAHPALAALSSHYVQYPMPEVETVRLWPLVLLRHPIDRIGSVYAFERRRQDATPGAALAKEKTFAEYVEALMHPAANAVVRNFQTRYCCDRHVTNYEPATEADYEAALHNLRQNPLVGIVDRYDESAVLFEETLRPFFPEIDLAYLSRNVTPGRARTLAERVPAVLARLGPDLSALVEEKNQFDMRLYEAASDLVQERIGATPGFDQKLKAFRRRCRWLRWRMLLMRPFQNYREIRARLPFRSPVSVP